VVEYCVFVLSHVCCTIMYSSGLYSSGLYSSGLYSSGLYSSGLLLQKTLEVVRSLGQHLRRTKSWRWSCCSACRSRICQKLLFAFRSSLVQRCRVLFEFYEPAKEAEWTEVTRWPVVSGEVSVCKEISVAWRLRSRLATDVGETWRYAPTSFKLLFIGCLEALR